MGRVDNTIMDLLSMSVPPIFVRQKVRCASKCYFNDQEWGFAGRYDTKMTDADLVLPVLTPDPISRIYTVYRADLAIATIKYDNTTQLTRLSQIGL